MKIGITCYPTYGGSGVVATELGKALAQRGHEIHFISYSLPFRLTHYHERLFFHEVAMVDYPLLEHPPYAIALAAKMSEVAAQANLDIFHVHYAMPHAVSAYLARAILGAGRPKIITTLHGTDITLVGNDRSLFPMTRFALEQSDGITCVSRYLRARTYQVFDIAKPLKVIPNFVDTKRFTPEGRPYLREHLAPRGEHILAHLSNFRAVSSVGLSMSSACLKAPTANECRPHFSGRASPRAATSLPSTCSLHGGPRPGPTQAISLSLSPSRVARWPCRFSTASRPASCRK